MRLADIISATILCALGLIAIVAIIPAQVAGDGGVGDLSPAFMPYVAAIIATATMALLLVARLARAAASEEPVPLTTGSWLFIATAAAALAGAFFLMQHFGYLVGAAAIVAAFMAMARARPAVVVAVAATFPPALWLLFDKLLGFPLP